MPPLNVDGDTPGDTVRSVHIHLLRVQDVSEIGSFKNQGAVAKVIPDIQIIIDSSRREHELAK